jgi:hypothetical protein
VDRSGERGDLELFPVFALLWAVSVAVVVESLLRHDVFGPEATIALGLVLVLPWLVVRSRRSDSVGEKG